MERFRLNEGKAIWAGDDVHAAANKTGRVLNAVATRTDTASKNGMTVDQHSELEELLASALWAEMHFGSLCAAGETTQEDLEEAAKAGYLKSVGMTIVCEDDGSFRNPCSQAEGFVLTEAGRTRLHTADAKRGKSLGSGFTPLTPSHETQRNFRPSWC